MTPVTGKTVYALGAGASVHTGAPVLSNFLMASRALHNSSIKLRFKDSFEKVFTWIDNLRSSSYYADFDLDNLEHVFSLIHLASQIGIKDGEEMIKHITRVVLETLDSRCALAVKEKQILPDQLYQDFIALLVALNNQRRMDCGERGFAHDAIITFNYDPNVDYALHFKGTPFSYHVRGHPANGFPLLKLHGSTNWVTCSKCPNFTLTVLDPTPLPPRHRLHPFAKDGSPFSFKMVTAVLPEHECPSCRTKDTFQPKIIPPTWSKGIANTQLEPVWKASIDAISTAQQLVVIGYSLPSTDTFFQYLMTLGLEKNSNLQRVVIVNPDPSVMDRYQRTFSRSMHARGQLLLIEMYFDEFVREHMSRIGSSFA